MVVQRRQGIGVSPSSLEEFLVADIFSALAREKWLVFSSVIGVLVLTTLMLLLIAPRYTAETLILVESPKRSLIRRDAALANVTIDDETIASEIDIIRSRHMVKKVINDLGLYQDEEFVDVDSQSGKEPSARIEARAIKKFDEHLEVYQKGTSRAIAIEFTSEDSAKAALVANTLAYWYIHEQVEVKYQANQQVNTWLKQQLATLRKDVEVSEAAVERFRQNSGLLQGKDGILAAQQISELNTQLILAETARSESESRLRQVRTLFDGQNRAVESVSEVLDSALIQDLRSQEAELQRKVAELSTEYGERHPKMVNFLSELGGLQGKIKAEVDKIVQGLENEVAVAKARQASLQESLEELKSQVAQSNQNEVGLRALEREAEAYKNLFNNFLSRFKEISSQNDRSVQQADSRVISRADIPAEHSYPKKIPILILMSVVSAIGGAAWVFFRDRFDQSFRSGDEVENAVGVRSLGLVPSLGEKNTEPGEYIQSHPQSAFGESINTLRWHLNIIPDKPPKSVLITSAQPKEGKTTVAVCLAKAQILAGKSVLIIDADCRKHSVGQVLGVSSGTGLNELLNQEVSLANVIKRDGDTGIDVITAGKSPVNPANLLKSSTMDRLLESLANRYDLIILDSPPVMAGLDATILSTKVDATLFLVRWGRTRRDAVHRALKQIESSGGNIAGVLLSMVDVAKLAWYGYGDSGAYTQRFDRYYQNE